jgi:3-dehydrosphinganine reductase
LNFFFGQTVVITGGSDGMGKAVALQLSAKGANVLIVARTVSKLVATVDEMKVRHFIHMA